MFNRCITIFFLSLVSALFISTTPAESGERVSVFVAGDDGYHTFRIPAVIAAENGDLLAICEGRKDNRADHGDIDLVMKRSTDQGKTWGKLRVIHEQGGTEKVTIGNPCPVLDRSNGRLILPFTRDNDDVLVTYSDDHGQTWSKPVDITSQVKPKGWTWYATGPGIGIQLMRGKDKGRLVIPCDHRELWDGASSKVSHCFYSDDGGATWAVGESVAQHTDECQVVELGDGRLMINMRNYWERDGKEKEKGAMRAVSFSEYGGRRWGPLRFDEALIEPVCQASLIKVDGDQSGESTLFFSNPASRNKRHLLTVRSSHDEGRTWTANKLIHEGPAAYSCLIALGSNQLGCLYERGEKHAYEEIVFERIALPLE